MLTYKEIAEIAEERLDQLASMPLEEAVNYDNASIMDIALETVGIYGPRGTVELDGITKEDRRRVVLKVADYCGKLYKTAMNTQNIYGVSNARFIHCTMRQCREWLKSNPTA